MSFADLQAQVRDARTRVSLDDIHDRGGPSPNWIRRIVRARPSDWWDIRPGTLAEIDHGFAWPDGTAADLYYQDTERQITVRDVDELAQLLGDHVLAEIVTRLRIGVGLADAPQSA